jgi:putative nucleotidyltransferase with HDIG domain
MGVELIEAAQEAERSGSWNRAIELYQGALDEATSRSDAVRAAEVLRWIGRVYRLRGDLELAEAAYRQSLTVAEDNGLTLHIASALNVLAMVDQLHGNVDAAEQRYSRARKLAVETGDDRLIAMIEQNIATMANIRGETDRALRTYAAVLARYQALKDDLACAYALNNMGMAHTDRGEWSMAAARFGHALDYARRTGDQEILGTVHLNAAELYLKSADMERAREHSGAAFSIFSRLQSRTGLAETYKLYAAIYRAADQPELAESHLLVTVELARSCEDRLLEAEIEQELALLHTSQGRNREALMSLNRAHAIFADFKARKEIVDIDKRLDRIEETYLEVMHAWGESIESKDHYTAGHCERVADYACMLAEAAGFAGRDLTWMRMGAFLHDIGKTSVPSEVLNKPGRLSNEEFELMKLHTVWGDEIISETPFPWDIRPIVRNHHERWDGSGYPDGMRGEEIPLTARILCVADVYDALTTNRSYRAALSRDEALATMEKEAGSVLDPTLYAIFRAELLKAG